MTGKSTAPFDTTGEEPVVKDWITSGCTRRRPRSFLNCGLDEKPVCPAYPKGIPDRIAYGPELHLTVQEDQEGEIVFEKTDG